MTAHTVRWIKARLRRRNETGSTMVEALVIMLLVTTVAAGYVGVQAAVSRSADQQQAITAVDQKLSGLAEATKALPWNALTMCRSTILPVPPGSTTTPPVQTLESNCPDPVLEASSTETIDGRDVTFTSEVHWVLPTAASPTPANAGSYGLKRITISATWTDPGAPAPVTDTVVIERTPTLDEASPR